MWVCGCVWVRVCACVNITGVVRANTRARRHPPAALPQTTAADVFGGPPPPPRTRGWRLMCRVQLARARPKIILPAAAVWYNWKIPEAYVRCLFRGIGNGNGKEKKSVVPIHIYVCVQFIYYTNVFVILLLYKPLRERANRLANAAAAAHLRLCTMWRRKYYLILFVNV